MRQLAAATALIVVLVSSGVAMAYSSGPPLGLTGAPGEGTCANCHDNLNVGPGWVSITVPSDYSAGEIIDVTVQVGQTGQQRWGFSITALDDSNQPVGHFTITDPVRTEFDTDSGSGREYVMQTGVGSDAGVPDVSPGWTFQWTAPAARPGVTFYVCGVAANDAQGTNGDYVYTSASNLSETGAASSEVTWGRMKSLFR